MYIHWGESLELHNELIDTQHRMLVLLCRKLDIAIKSKVPDQRIRWIVLELKKFAEFHFLSEENLMHEVDYPDVDNHALLHTDLLMRLDMMIAKISHHKEFPDDLLHFLNKWLVQHVAAEDLKIAEYLRQSGKRPLGEGLYHEYLLSAPPGRV
ncbi:MAG: hemerythrin family protein [Betaproteobacteria bacterium]|nr:hemerythrin family protein [Betaproteobacteria bacterium]MDE2622584.1 hemerythrin family protein [Betaproteobacteria bacterium]